MGEPPINGNHQGQKKCQLKRVFPYARLKMQCLYVDGTTTKCPLMGGVHLWEVSISRDSTVHYVHLAKLCYSRLMVLKL